MPNSISSAQPQHPGGPRALVTDVALTTHDPDGAARFATLRAKSRPQMAACCLAEIHVEGGGLWTCLLPFGHEGAHQ